MSVERTWMQASVRKMVITATGCRQSIHMLVDDDDRSTSR